ncbi:MAG TPA: OB-fold nucleic acid binding domain-containing protein [Methanothermobacter sp.]|nr:putative membrane protein [Methanothermobacter sp. MT-2]HHW04931.1 DNA-binding protein [Methanothermobacter sp.]HOK73292.1 OB-fold nucleic acid binding domain-containing protein [Methanothermobacter sp.]HOL69791.1 OB-fold nucleic acid binding domain-containing protein [Methanothermobacter sp.]HPQ05014.1 OB-fold nucleic acid binding domain-containing protein [Methanothermobacter sp.]
MEDEQIFKIVIFIALTGLIGMIISAGSITPREVKIKEINKGMIDEKVTITGFVEEIKQSKTGKASFITLNDGTGKITIVIFEELKNEMGRSNINMETLKYKKIKITGKVTEYKGSMEIILEEPQNLKILNPP